MGSTQYISMTKMAVPAAALLPLRQPHFPVGNRRPPPPSGGGRDFTKHFISTAAIAAAAKKVLRRH